MEYLPKYESPCYLNTVNDLNDAPLEGFFFFLLNGFPCGPCFQKSSKLPVPHAYITYFPLLLCVSIYISPETARAGIPSLDRCGFCFKHTFLCLLSLCLSLSLTHSLTHSLPHSLTHSLSLCLSQSLRTRCLSKPCMCRQAETRPTFGCTC